MGLGTTSSPQQLTLTRSMNATWPGLKVTWSGFTSWAEVSLRPVVALSWCVLEGGAQLDGDTVPLLVVALQSALLPAYVVCDCAVEPLEMAWEQHRTKQSPHCARQSSPLVFNTLWPRQNGRHFATNKVTWYVVLWFYKPHFQMDFLQWKYFNFDWKFHRNLFPKGVIDPTLVQINGLAPNTREAIIWTNDCIVYCRIYTSFGPSVLTMNN